MKLVDMAISQENVDHSYNNSYLYWIEQQWFYEHVCSANTMNEAQKSVNEFSLFKVKITFIVCKTFFAHASQKTNIFYKTF